jgi:hypothetical protein
MNDLFISKILDDIPSNIKPVDFLMDSLNIGKESAYRRIRGDIPFSFREISALSLKLGFSVDELVGKSKKTRIFFGRQGDASYTPSESFVEMLTNFYQYYVDLYESPKSKVIISMNKIFVVFLIGYDPLFKFYYYKWTYETTDVPLNYGYSEVTIPDEVLSLYHKIKAYLLKTSELTFDFIADRYTFLNIIRDIHYYYKRKLISDEELSVLKKDLNYFNSQTEESLHNGVSKSGSIFNYYLSTINVETNSSYTVINDRVRSDFWMYPINPVIIYDQEICAIHKKWINSLKKYAVLITHSNEVLLADFLNEMNEYVTHLGTDSFEEHTNRS